MKVPYKHSYRRQRTVDGLPSIRQQEKGKRATHERRVANEAAAVEARIVERDEQLRTAKFSVEQGEASMRRGR